MNKITKLSSSGRSMIHPFGSGLFRAHVFPSKGHQNHLTDGWLLVALASRIKCRILPGLQMTHSHSIYILENFPSFSGHFSEKSLSSGKSNVEEAYQYSTSTPKDHQPLSPRIPRSLFLRAGLTLRQGQCLLWDVIFFFIV